MTNFEKMLKATQLISECYGENLKDNNKTNEKFAQVLAHAILPTLGCSRTAEILQDLSEELNDQRDTIIDIFNS